MKEQEKQIEEIVCCETCIHKGVCYDLLTNTDYEFKGYGCLRYCHDFTKDSVVLSREELQNIKTLEYMNGKTRGCTESIGVHLEQLEKTEKKASKETAEKILNELVGHTFEDDGWTWTVSKEDIQWLAEKYKVDIKE